MKSLLLLHGPNLNKLGRRNTEIYGKMTLNELEETVREKANSLGLKLICFQSNHEGELIDFIQEHSDQSSAMLINPGALSHTSYALHDAILDSELPTIEVHLSNIYERESWRTHSVISPACASTIVGKHVQGYLEAVELLMERIDDN